jgi:hypothetical protein
MSNRSPSPKSKPQHKKRSRLQPITLDEVMSGAGMGGYISFLEGPSKAPHLQKLLQGEDETTDTVPFEGTVPLEDTVPHKGLVRQKKAIPDAALDSVKSLLKQSVSVEESVSAPGSEDTVSSKDPVSSQGTVSLVQRQPKIYRCNTVQDGHSFAEDRLYNALWNVRTARMESKETRLVSIGWRTMSALASMTPRNVKENCRRLVQKFALEIADTYDSNTRRGTTYRVNSFQKILEFRKSAGLEWVVRNRGGVTFVSAHGVPIAELGDTVSFEATVSSKDTVSSQTIVSVSLEAPVPVASKDTPLDTVDRTAPSSPSSSLEPDVVIDTLRLYAATVDDVAVQKLFHSCQSRAADCTTEEILHFIHQKAATMQNIKNPLGFLLTAVPRCFEGESFRQFRKQRKSREVIEQKEVSISKQTPLTELSEAVPEQDIRILTLATQVIGEKAEPWLLGAMLDVVERNREGLLDTLEEMTRLGLSFPPAAASRMLDQIQKLWLVKSGQQQG